MSASTHRILGVVAVVVIDWLIRTRKTINPAGEPTDRVAGLAGLTAFVLAHAAAIPSVHTSLIKGPTAMAWHDALRRLPVGAHAPQGLAKKFTTDWGPRTTDYQGFASPPQPRV